MASLILTIVGPDRPGLVRALSEAPESLLAVLPSLEQEGLRITATHAGAAGFSPATGPRLLLEVVGNDRPGIVHDITGVLAVRGVNIEELTTQIESTPFSGDPLFRATITLRAPSEETVKTLSAGLERLGNEMMVDIQPLDT